MASKNNLGVSNRTRTLFYVILVISLCCFFYLLGSWQKSGFGTGDLALEVTKPANCTTDIVKTDIVKTDTVKTDTVRTDIVPTDIVTDLDFEPHHKSVEIPQRANPKPVVFKPCDIKYKDYTPCQEQNRAMRFPREHMIYRERHCPAEKEKLRCLIPAPRGYMTPFLWPKSRDYVHYANVPFKSLTVEKKKQNWVKFQGKVFKFPGGGTMFPQGADAYIEELATVIPIKDGYVRTALDTGCGVASWGAYMLKKNVLTMSFAPRDNHEAQVQFALERGVPAMIAVLGSIRLPYPPRAFDMAHCSRCLIPWTLNEGMYMMEVDRVLRPGGYWVLSGPPINWKTYYKTWKRSKKELNAEQKKIEEVAESLCWEKKYEKGDIAIWRKKTNDRSCDRSSSVKTCKDKDTSDVWYKKIEVCVAPFPKVSNKEEVAGGQLTKFPKRLYSVPPCLSKGLIKGVTVESYLEDNKLWNKCVSTYKRINRLIGSTRYRNVMDMNAGLGGFAAALESPKSWTMNVVPIIAKNTLSVVYERGLIGIYHDWCEGFSTYPRTYDLIHANNVFSLYQNSCKMEDILLEMDRILRPEGTVIFRDEVDVLNDVRKITKGMRWNTKLMDHEDGPLVPEKILVAVKNHWVAGDDGGRGNRTSPSSS